MSNSSVGATSIPHFLKLEGAAAMKTVSYAATQDAFADAAEADVRCLSGKILTFDHEKNAVRWFELRGLGEGRAVFALGRWKRLGS